MKFTFYTHSLVSDWNHGNAHFLRGIMRDLARRGHNVRALEPANGWSRQNLLREAGPTAVKRFHAAFPVLRSRTYDAGFEHEAAVEDSDVVVVHEWTDPALVARIGRMKRNGGRFTLLFHDTHHRAVSAREDIAELQLEDYDAILAFGETLRQRYLNYGWGNRAFTWHEAADDLLFRPLPNVAPRQDLIWIGNWGDGERKEELRTFLIAPAAESGLSAVVHGVRYPEDALQELSDAGISYRGWIANAEVPQAFAESRVTVHVPRRPYVESLPGIPTIRVFEALACGIPLISAPWDDAEELFAPGKDFLVAPDGQTMTQLLREVVHDPAMSAELSQTGRKTILARHTCRHRVDELLTILDICRGTAGPPEKREAAE